MTATPYPHHPSNNSTLSYRFCTEKFYESKEVDVESPVYHTLIPDKTFWIILQLKVSYPGRPEYTQTQGWEGCEVGKRSLYFSLLSCACDAF